MSHVRKELDLTHLDLGIIPIQGIRLTVSGAGSVADELIALGLLKAGQYLLEKMYHKEIHETQQNRIRTPKKPTGKKTKSRG